MPEGLLVLCGFAFLAGFIDAIVGGGGLIQLPMLLITLPSYPLATLLGTNKLVSITGTSMATYQYARRLPLQWRWLLPTALAAFACSFVGARVVSLLSEGSDDALRPVIIVLLLLIALYIFFKKDFGAQDQAKVAPRWQVAAGMLAGGAIGFYDGFFGPGTGSFLIFAFISIFGLGFLMASASAKAVNVATNLAALAYFAFSGNVLLQYAIPMAVFNILGAVAGSRLAMLKGNRFIRVLFLLIILGLVAKLIADSV